MPFIEQLVLVFRWNIFDWLCERTIASFYNLNCTFCSAFTSRFGACPIHSFWWRIFVLVPASSAKWSNCEVWSTVDRSDSGKTGKFYRIWFTSNIGGTVFFNLYELDHAVIRSQMVSYIYNSLISGKFIKIRVSFVCSAVWALLVSGWYSMLRLLLWQLFKRNIR